MVDGLVPHQHQARHPDHPVLGGQVSLSLDVDSAALDVTRRQLGSQLLKLRLKHTTRPAPVSVELHQTVPPTLHTGAMEVVSCQLGRPNWHWLRIEEGNLIIIRRTQGSEIQRESAWYVSSFTKNLYVISTSSHLTCSLKRCRSC